MLTSSGRSGPAGIGESKERAMTTTICQICGENAEIRMHGAGWCDRDRTTHRTHSEEMHEDDPVGPGRFCGEHCPHFEPVQQPDLESQRIAHEEHGGAAGSFRSEGCALCPEEPENPYDEQPSDVTICEPVLRVPVLRCSVRHPSHPEQVRCEEPEGHFGSHFHSFFMRSWEDEPVDESVLSESDR
jgi:hypothetical protein